MELYVDYEFKKVSNEELQIIDKAVDNVMRKFTLILAYSESSVYKILNHLIKKHKLEDKYIKTLDGTAIECYFDVNANPKYNHIQMNKLLESGVLSDVSGKLLFIPKMTNKWNKELAFYFYNEIRYAGCLGIVFYSEGKDNFGKILLEETTLDVIQFPRARYGKRKEIVDDGW